MPKTRAPLIRLSPNVEPPLSTDIGEPEYEGMDPRAPQLWLERRLGQFVRTRTQVVEGARQCVGKWSQGIYFMVNGESIEYVGLTRDWQHRADTHAKRGMRWDRLFTIDVPHANVMPYVEWPYIVLVDSPLNVKRVPPPLAGVSECLLAMIREVWES